MRLLKITSNDLTELQKIGRQTFVETFGAVNSQEDMTNYLENGFSTEKLTIELNNINSEFYFAKLDNEIIGYLKINFDQAQTELKDPNALEIERIYVLKVFHGKKVGQLLFDIALKKAKNRNLDYIWLGVWEKNQRAIQFYTKNGFVEFDKHVFKLGNEEQTDLMMRLELLK